LDALLSEMTSPQATVTVQDPQGKKGVLTCPRCRRDTSHSILAIINSRDSDDSGLVDFFDHYLTVRCDGCGAVNFCHEWSCSEEEDFDERGRPFLVKHKEMYPPQDSPLVSFVSPERQQQLDLTNSKNFDLSKLRRLVVELNGNYAAASYYSCLFTLRALLDHVAPAFGMATFSEVANNYGGGGRSFQQTMQHLENSSRKISDACLHTPLRRRENLPTTAQVEFRADVDVLLGEMIRILR
jgi:hypothetical protein